MPTPDETAYHELLKTLHPPLRAIITALGIARAQEFLFNHGGTFVKLPRADGSKLGLSNEELLALRYQLHDVRLATGLSSHLSDDGCISLPKADKIFLKYRNFEIRAMRGQLTLNQLAVKFDLTSRQVQNVLKGGEAVDQSDLFKMIDSGGI
ncbi:MAG: hypothetical protein WAW36_01055 [Methylovulum miyakonense]|uniref:hypothetical protein n=1 Tax=Methylovulum miyakonense TaxID=645578 RepID=UPI003BB5E5B1